MNFFQKIFAVWQKVSLIQRAVLTAVSLTFVIVGGMLVHWARKPDLGMLYQGLVPEEAAKITDKLSEKNVTYELRGGTSIYVPKDKIYQLRLDMAKDGLPSGEQGGYKIFDNEKLGISPFVQNINLKRALEEELSKSIQMIEGVGRSRVHIVSAEQKLFASQASPTSASIVLQIKSGYKLSGANIAAITHLVAGSVEGLKVENVTVIDSQGRLLSGESDHTVAKGANTVQDYRERVEQNLASKIEDMLATVLGPGRATVKVSAVIDMTSVNFTTETYDPTKKVATKEEIKSNSETGPSSTTGKSEQAVPGGTKKDENTLTEYVVGKTIEQKIVLPGEIKSLKVAAVVDLTPAAAADANAAKQAGTGKVMAVEDVEKLIRNALGLGKEDPLTVVEAKFYRLAEPIIEEKESNWPRYIAIARQASLGLMAVCALLVLRIFSKATRQVLSAGSVSAVQLSSGEGVAGLLPAGAGKEAEPQILRRQIAASLQNNPEQTRELFLSWLEEKVG